MEDELRVLLTQAVWHLESATRNGHSKEAKNYSRVVVNLTDAIMMFKYHKEECDGEDWK